MVRHKLTVRVAGGGFFMLSIWWLVGERTPQAVVSLAMALAIAAASRRALIVVREDTLYRRGLLGWDKRPLLLDELTAVSLRREAQFRYFPLTLRLSGPDRTEVSLECWAWAGWRELAHRAGHFARRLDARRDGVTERRLACARPGCQWESHAREVVGGRRAGPPPDDDLSGLNFRESVALIAALFGFGFALGLFVGWFQTEEDVGPLVPFALLLGGLLAFAGVCGVLWDKLKGRSASSPASSEAASRQGPRRRQSS